jgi:spore coat protein CotH
MLVTLAAWLTPGLLQGVPADEAFFTNGIVRTFRLQVDEAGLKQLKAGNREYVRATLTEGDQAFKDVGVRLKGHGSFRPVNEKPGLTVKFNRFNPGQKYRGLTKLQFNNAVHDRSYLREALATQMFQEAGVPAPRATHACLTLNGRDLGLYVVVEAANKVFLRRRFKDASGNLYEGFLQDVDGQPEQDSGTNTTRADLKALALTASEPDPDQRLQAVGRFLDVDQFLTFVAMETLTARWDGYARNMANYRALP